MYRPNVPRGKSLKTNSKPGGTWLMVEALVSQWLFNFLQ